MSNDWKDVEDGEGDNPHNIYGEDFGDVGRFNAVSASTVIAYVAAAGFFVMLFFSPVLYRYATGESFGGDCYSGDDCKSGICMTVQTGGGILGNKGGFCSDECFANSDCPESHLCDGGACVPEPSRENGESCTAAWDCISGECMVQQKSSGYGGLGGYPDPLAEYESTGTCVEPGEVERRREQAREAQEAMRELQEQMRQLQESMGGESGLH